MNLDEVSKYLSNENKRKKEVLKKVKRIQKGSQYNNLAGNWLSSKNLKERDLTDQQLIDFVVEECKS